LRAKVNKYFLKRVFVSKKLCTFANIEFKQKIRFVMCTVLVTYNPRNKVANGLIKTLSHVRGVKIDDDAILTDDEIIRIEESRRSGVADLDELKKFLRQ
jgi:hypothetical protein